MKLSPKHREVKTKTLFKKEGNAVGFKIDEVRLPNGVKAQREYMTHPGAVGVLAFASPKEILLVKQYRHPIGDFTYEIPAGKLGKGENPFMCIKRELAEETGYIAKKVWKILDFWPTAAFSDEVIHLYVAEDLKPGEANPDDDEFLEVIKVTPTVMESMIRNGKIHDSKTLIAYFAFKSGVI